MSGGHNPYSRSPEDFYCPQHGIYDGCQAEEFIVSREYNPSLYYQEDRSSESSSSRYRGRDDRYLAGDDSYRAGPNPPDDTNPFAPRYSLRQDIPYDNETAYRSSRPDSLLVGNLGRNDVYDVSPRADAVAEEMGYYEEYGEDVMANSRDDLQGDSRPDHFRSGHGRSSSHLAYQSSHNFNAESESYMHIGQQDVPFEINLIESGGATRARGHRCDFPGCRGRFTTGSLLRRHERSCHRQDGGEPEYFCKVLECTHRTPFSRRDNLIQHIRNVHGYDITVPRGRGSMATEIPYPQ